MALPCLSVIVLNNNHRDDVMECITSLYQNDYPNLQVIMLDNASTDDSVAIVCKKFPEVQLISLVKNLGYAGNNNVGLQAALTKEADWILILNDDTVLASTCLAQMVRAGESDPNIGIVGPMVYHFDEPEVIQSAGGMLGKKWQSIHLGKDEIDQGQFDSIRPVEWISGCAIMVRRAVLERIGLLDADYFLYWEDTEWCIRASEAGWKIIHVPNAKLWHKGVKRNYQPKPYVTYYVTRNYLFTLAKHNAPLFVRASAFVEIFRTLLSWTLKPRWRSKHDHRDAMWHGLIDFCSHRMGPMLW
jgi:GT2 family glycosyltransferase